MHPGPVNEGIEISYGLQNSEKSLINDQVEKWSVGKMCQF